MWPFNSKKEITHISETVIVIEGQHYRKHDPEEWEERKLIKIIEEQTKIIDKLTDVQKQKPILALKTLINNQFFIMGDIALTLGATPPTGVFTLLDAKDGSVLSATFSNQQIGANSNPEFATFALDGNGNVIPTAVAEGSGTIDLSAHADYTDKGDNSTQSQDFTVTKNFSVVSTPTPNGAKLDVVFS